MDDRSFRTWLVGFDDPGNGHCHCVADSTDCADQPDSYPRVEKRNSLPGNDR